ncbi:MAG: ABC transporter permease [Sandaracinaceae bacterium]|jgi:peptide/nickel transport system permease protein|nr:ABC transporter permease [Sandaracinaceae bacterium]
MKRLRKMSFGVFVVAIFALIAIFGPWLAPFSPSEIDLTNEYVRPSESHWLGTTDNGVDILSVILHGARLAGLVGITVVAISLVLGTLAGMAAAYRGGKLDHAITGFADLMQPFPSVMLNVAMLALVAKPGVLHLVLALLPSGWVIYARIARAQTLTLREREYVQAGRALGMSDRRIILRHIFPNLASPLAIQATSHLGGAILAESTLSFLGLGPGRAASWGALLDQGSAVLLRFPHVALIAGGTIAITVLGFNLAGDWLRDRLDPRSRNSR